MAEADPLPLFAAAVLAARRAAGLSQEQYAERCNLSTRYISSIERGAQEPKLRAIGKLAVGIGLQPSQLLRKAKL